MAEARYIYGFHAIGARLRNDPESVLDLYFAAQRTDARARDLLARAELAKVKMHPTDVERLDGMAGSPRHQGVVARVSANPRALRLEDVLEGLNEPALFLVLDGVQDPHNLGACLRVADGAGAHAVIVPKDRAAGINATVIKVASGAADTTPFIAVTNLARTLRELQEAGVWCLGAAGEAPQDIYAIDQRGPTAWVMGAEGDGLRRLTRDTCDQLARIPMYGSVESLNVSVASGICLYEVRRQRTLGR